MLPLILKNLQLKIYKMKKNWRHAVKYGQRVIYKSNEK